MGSLICEDHLEKVSAHVGDARALGAEVLTGGRARPETRSHVLRADRAARGHCGDKHATEETFGRVTTIYTYSSVDDAVAMANGTAYGLNARIWGTDLAAAEAVGRRIQAGNINVNDSLAAAYASKATPSGGLRSSGVGSRHGDGGLLKYTDPVHVAVMKKQVLTPPADIVYDKHVKQTLISLRAMRKLRIR